MKDDNGLKKAWRNVWLYTAAIAVVAIISALLGFGGLALVLVGIWVFLALYFLFNV